MREKVRLDQKLYKMGLASSRERAKAEIIAGSVYVNSQKNDKPSYIVQDDDVIEIKSNVIPFVSRGGLKLNKALEAFNIDVNGLTCADIGSSTGGFTDCMLQKGAKKVYAVDVGYGQLDWKLRNDPRVKVMERHNARYMTPDWFDEKLQFASVDVSFISLKKILPGIKQCLELESSCVVLIKPQFEAGRENVGKNGVVKDSAVHREVISEIIGFSRSIYFDILGLDFSPIIGPKGNIEFLLHLGHAVNTKWMADEDAERIEYVLRESRKLSNE